jgi:cytochrome c oxidase subunit IV
MVNYNMNETNEKEQASTHKIGIYLWIWGLLFVLSFFFIHGGLVSISRHD